MTTMEYPDQSGYHFGHHHDQVPQGMPAYMSQQNMRGYVALANQSVMAGMPNSLKQNDTKPRLGKEEVEILEREFQRNTKPTTQVKRQFAEEMGVDLARINNWFQNRRAKRKQELKQEAYEAGQAREAPGYSKPSPPDAYYSNTSGIDSNMLPMQEPSSSFMVGGGPPPAVAPYNPQYPDPTTASMESLHRTMAAAQAASKHGDLHEGFTDQQETLAEFTESLLQNSTVEDRARFPSVAPFDLDHFPYTGFPDSLYSTPGQSLPESQPSPPTGHTPTPFHAYTAGTDIHGPQPLTTFPSQLLHMQHHDSMPSLSNESIGQASPEMSTSTLAIGFNYDIDVDIEESEEPTESPPAPSLSFKSPPPTDIASRRKKVHVKPAALTADTMRSRQSTALRTVSNAEMFRRGSDSSLASPMRRNVSSGGSRGIMSGRINKSSLESSQRSPLNLGGFADAEGFIGRNFHNIRQSASAAVGTSLNRSFAPLTPMSPRRGEMSLLKREGSWPATSSIDGGSNYIFNASVPGFFTTVEGDKNLASPPETPHDPSAIPLLATDWHAETGLDDKQWNYETPDEPLFTPAQDSFQTDIQMPQPSYLSNLSQPVTPAFGHFNPNFSFGHDSPQYNHESPIFSQQHQPEYLFHDSPYFGDMLCSSPKTQKTFLFSNATPADFLEK